MDELTVKLIEHGFAIAVASYLLLRTDRHIQELKNAVVQLTNIIAEGRTRR